MKIKRRIEPLLAVIGLLVSICLVVSVFLISTRTQTLRNDIRTVMNHEKILLQAIQERDAQKYQSSGQKILDELKKFSLVRAYSVTSKDYGMILAGENPIENGITTRLEITGDSSVWVLDFVTISDFELLSMLRASLAILMIVLFLVFIRSLHQPKTNPSQDDMPRNATKENQIQAESELEQNSTTKNTTEDEAGTQAVTNSGETESAQEKSPIFGKTPTKQQAEAFLHRLNHELIRAGENALDASLLVISGFDEEKINTMQSLLLQEFIHDDLLFQISQTHFAIILPHHDIDQTMARAEFFLRRCQTVWSGPQNDRIICGISSRSGRIIDSKTLLHEAQIAVKKARKEFVPIVGFKADPGKYRNFLLHSMPS